MVSRLYRGTVLIKYPMKKLVVRLKGGLGNQLFCYATAKRLALVNGAQVILDYNTGFKRDRVYRRSFALSRFSINAKAYQIKYGSYYLERVTRLMQRRVEQRIPYSERHLIEQTGTEFDPNLLHLRLNEGESYFDGFGQSEDYFFDIKEIIKADLTLQAPINPLALALRDEIVNSQSIGIHVRWFDNGTGPQSVNMPLDYYRRALENLNTIGGGTKIFVFSDKPESAEVMLRPILSDCSWSLIDIVGAADNSIDEFWLMSHCKQIVISNSTFAWWAAWLGEANGNASRIVAPGRKIEPVGNITAWGFPHLLPERWTII
jgi:hypothetical protein